MDVEVQLDDTIPLTMADEKQIAQVFLNIINNAFQAMEPAGGRLNIRSMRKSGNIVFTIQDTGCGIQEEHLLKIFDPFFSLKEVGKGTGLGLSTTHGILEQHQGSISVSSRPGKGSKFIIHLPCKEEQAGLKKPKERKDITFGEGQRILIVDDDSSSLDSLAGLLKHMGYEPIPVSRPAEAIEYYGQWAPDAVLMDRNMPGMDGITCIKEIVRTDSGAKIIVISGYGESGPNGIDEDVGGLIKGYLTKPCSIAELSSTLARVLGP